MLAWKQDSETSGKSMLKEAQRSTRNGYFRIALASLIWGSIGIVVRAVPFSALTVVAYRVILVLPLFLIVLLRHGGFRGLRGTPDLRLLVASGALQTVAWTALFTAFKLTGVANGVVLLFTAPIIVALLAPYLLSERRQPGVYASLSFATVGIVLIFANEGLGERLEFFGVLSGLAAGFLFALLIMSDRRLSQSYPSQIVVTVQLMVASVLLAPVPFLEQRLPTYYELGLLAILGFVHTGLCLYLYIGGLQFIPAQHAVVIQYLEPASAILYSALILSELPAPISLLGGILIIAANLILALRNSRAQPT